MDNDTLRQRTKEIQQQVQGSAKEQKARIAELKATIENTPIDERADIFAQIDKIEKEVLDIYEKESMTDYLTGLDNRRGAENFFALNRDKWIKGKKDLVFLSVDVDYLKKTNDTYGHDAGDTIIKACAEALNRVVPKGGCIIRMGGDEFLVAVIGDEEFGEFLMNRVFEQIKQWNLTSGKPYPLSVSAGFYSVRADSDLDIHRCIRRADQAMYQYKTDHRKIRTDEEA